MNTTQIHVYAVCINDREPENLWFVMKKLDDPLATSGNIVVDLPHVDITATCMAGDPAERAVHRFTEIGFNFEGGPPVTATRAIDRANLQVCLPHYFTPKTTRLFDQPSMLPAGYIWVSQTMLADKHKLPDPMPYAEIVQGFIDAAVSARRMARVAATVSQHLATGCMMRL